MPPRVEAALYVLGAVAMFWAAIDYANHMVDNIRAGQWIGGVVDGLIWLGGLTVAMGLAKRAQEKWK